MNRISSIGYRIKQSGVRQKEGGKGYRDDMYNKQKEKETITDQPISKDFSIIFSHVEIHVTTESQVRLLYVFISLLQPQMDQLITVKPVPTESPIWETHLLPLWGSFSGTSCCFNHSAVWVSHSEAVWNTTNHNENIETTTGNRCGATTNTTYTERASSSMKKKKLN